MFRSLRSSGANTPARKRDAALIDEAGEAPGPGRQEYRARHAQPDDDVGGSPEAGEVFQPTLDTADTAPVAESDPGPAGEPQTPHAEAVETDDEWAVDGEDGPDDFRFVVRPYSWTQGRTRPVQDLALETLVSTSDKGRDLTSICSAEHAAIAQLCTEIRSVAEVAALLSLPLGVARVLLADMIDTGLVHVHRNPMNWGDAPDLALLERVLDGLYRL
ncbi:MAG TPA: DUF742 domain-containing protein [Pseudonocardiaceae bacterium]|nr:DUF742 domain-containing protein [Pseudonocardiaceae bacterium]